VNRTGTRQAKFEAGGPVESFANYLKRFDRERQAEASNLTKGRRRGVKKTNNQKFKLDRRTR
jgi:hypothetical protein